MNRGRAMWGHSEKAALCKPRSEASLDTNHVCTLTVNLQLPELRENESLLFELPGLRYFVRAARAGGCAVSPSPLSRLFVACDTLPARSQLLSR